MNRKPKVRWTFETTEARDAFIEKSYPNRKCLSGPGAYRVPGGTLGVFMNEITFYPPKPRRREVSL